MKNTFAQNFFKSNNTDFLLNLTKIFIICFVAIALVLNVIPFYFGDGPYIYAITSINLSQGIYSITNDLLEETGRSEFVGGNWVKTEQNSAVPQAGPRISIIGTLFYFVGGYSGLLYLTPIFTILLLIFSERISTSLFGKYVGLLTLLFLATSNLIFRNSLRLQSDIVFSVFILLGFFFIIKYLKDFTGRNLIYASSFFAFASILRINGIIFFPVEIVLIVGYFLITITKKSENHNSKNCYGNILLKKLFRKKTLKHIIFLCLPWIIFFSSYAIYHDYYFGDPFTNYTEQTQRTHYDSDPISLLSFESQDYENIKAYSKYLLPYQFPAIYNKIDNNYDDIFSENWLGIISLLLLFSILIISIFTKKKRMEILILMLLILANLWFYSSITSAERAEQGVAGRYMIPVFTFSVMMISYLIIKGFERLDIHKNRSKLIKTTFLFIIGGFFITSFYFIPSVQEIFSEEPSFSNPEKLFERYPLDKEGLTQNSVIISIIGDRALEYGAIPFKISKGEISSDSFNLLKQTVENGYDVYVFKRSYNENEKNIIKELQNNFGVVLTEYSSNFCKVQIISATNATLKSDKICSELEPVK